jgi:hypothetical protein
MASGDRSTVGANSFVSLWRLTRLFSREDSRYRYVVLRLGSATCLSNFRLLPVFNF